MAQAQVGQQYRKIEGPTLVWEVINIASDLNGIRHCHIVNVNDPTNIKLISENILTKRRFYRLLA